MLARRAFLALPLLLVVCVLPVLGLLISSCGGVDYCAELTPCCEEVGSADVADTCRSTVDQGSSDDCKVALRSLQGVGLCLGGDAGPTEDTGPHLTPACLDLNDCCDQLDDDEKAPCYGSLAANDSAVCQAALDGYVGDGACTAP